MDFAKRAYDHSFPFDPIVRSLMDTDFYKLLMMQFIWKHYPHDMVSWKVTNRTKSVRIADDIDIGELRAQLDHARSLCFQPNEVIWLRGQTFYGRQGIFEEGFLNTLKHFRLPEYRLDVETDGKAFDDGLALTETGQFEITFEGRWWETTLWEIYALTIINEMRYRSIMRKMGKAKLDIMYARAKVKLYAKLERLATVAGLNLTDFGTRRRHSFLWQKHCVETAKEVLGDKFTGTSNVFLAMTLGLEAKGTNAHELPMVFAGLARERYPDNPEKLRESQYEVLKQWQTMYHDNLLVFLPDTFGTTQFLKNAPQWVAWWKGARPDSKEAIEGGKELIGFWRDNGITDEKIASEKLIVFSDGLDVKIDGFDQHGADIIAIHDYFRGKVGVGFGWGTLLTNDFVGCHPDGADIMKAISLVCKVHEVNGHSAVKLSDNFEKATGSASEIEYYRNAFGIEGIKNAPVLV